MKLMRLVVGLIACALLPGVAIADTITYYHNDLLGSPIVATDQAGAVVWRETFVPYGERMSPTLKPNKVWYTSRYQDDDTRLVYMGARHYDPVVGRFISRDSIAFQERNPHSFNPYVYANNNPYRYVDPDGKWAAHAVRFVFTISFEGATALGADQLGWLIAGGLWSALHSDSAQPENGKKIVDANAGNSTSPQTPPPDDDDGKPKRVTNPKHHPNSNSPEPRNVDQLYERSALDENGVRWAKDADGTLHRFSRASNGETHWNGSTGGADPIQTQNIPIEIRRLFGVKG